MPSANFATSCPPQPISNDEWTAGIVSDLAERLASQQGDPEHRTAVVVGAGGLPYIQRLLRASVVCQVNPNGEDVFAWASDQRARFETCTDWTEYHASARADLAEPHSNPYRQVSFYDSEQNAVTNWSGLQGDFDETKRAVRAARLEHFDDDLLAAAPSIGSLARRSGLTICAVNLTNVAPWVDVQPTGHPGSSREGRRLIVEGALQRWPLHPKAVIIDSSNSTLTPTLYTLQTYKETLLAGAPA